jgi:hypothetical protein
MLTRSYRVTRRILTRQRANGKKETKEKGEQKNLFKKNKNKTQS